ncbi:MAG: DUF2851 family protein [Chloroflexi bacterium]|nr:DUF2851 family protein [Chloroflexota bacterium]
MNNLTEKEIAEIWQNQLVEGDRLATEDGAPLQVIYPGRLNGDRGADFQQAVIVRGRELIRGDVEIHVRTSDWQAHGHHLDAAYNRVILHVAFWHDTGSPIRLQNRREVPTLALEKYVSLPVNEAPDSVVPEKDVDLPCVRLTCRMKASQAGELLDKAGDARFLIKADRFRQDLSRAWASQSLYQGVMGALGYSCNKIPFLELARRLPLRFLESVTRNNLPDAEWLLRRQALLLGTAGLLPLLCKNGWYSDIPGSERLAELERLWAASPPTRVMSLDDWRLVRARPNNSPIFRLLALSYLLLRYREPGWLEGLAGLVRQAPLSRGGHKSLEAGLTVTIDSFPSGCSGQSRRVDRLTLLGSQRADDIIINVLLPFTLAWSQSIAQPDSGDKAFELYRLYSRLTRNSVEERMTSRLGIDRKLVDSARRQQGLLHIHNNFCETGRCDECPHASFSAGTTSKSRPSVLPARKRK